MLKVLRKHNKWILVVGGSLLMIAWLMPQGIQKLGPASQGAVAGELDGRKVRDLELSTNEREVRAVGALIPTIVGGLLSGSAREAGAHWMLLSHEAQQAGLIGGPQDGADWLQEIAPSLAEQALFAQYQQQFPQLDERMFRQVILPSSQAALVQQTEQVRTYFAGPGLEDAARAGQLTVAQVHAALSKARGIFRLRNAYLSAVRDSDRAARVKAAQWGDQATAQAALIGAELLTDGVGEPTEAQLTEHYEKYRDAIPGTGEFGIGYRQPPRIKLEWLRLDRAAIRVAVPVDPIAAYKEYQLNRAQFPGEYADEKAAVEAELRDRRAGEVMLAAVQTVRAEVFKATKSLPRDGEYRTLPGDWQTTRPRLETIAQAVQAQVAESTGISIPLPTVVVRDAQWQTEEDLATEPDLSGAEVRYASRQFPLVRPTGAGQAPVAFQVRELGFETPLALQTGIPIVDYPAEDADRNTYFYTILDARKESAPESIDEVRTLAITDWKKLQAFQTLTARSDEFRQVAAAGGPGAVIDLFRKPPTDPPTPSPALPTVVNGVAISRAGVTGGAGLNTEAFRNAVMTAADAIDPLTEPAAYDPAGATVVVPIPETLSLAVVKITGRRPVTWEMYRREIENALAGQTQREVAQASATWPFSFEAVAARHGWVSRVDPNEEEEPAPADALPAEGTAPTTG